MSEKDKTVFKAQLATENVQPRTLTIKPLKFQQGDAEATFHGVYGGDNANVWVATFFDSDEAQAWVQASTVFGRPVLGASVPTQQEVADGTGKDSGTPVVLAS
jgi:hypothetical protein